MYEVEGRFYLVDLPGYGYAKASFAERRRLLHLLRGYLQSRDSMVGAVWLLDVRRDLSPDDRDIGTQLAERGVPVLLAITKADKLGRGQRLERSRRILQAVGLPEDQCIVTSAKTREGIQELRASIDALVARA